MNHRHFLRRVFRLSLGLVLLSVAANFTVLSRFAAADDAPVTGAEDPAVENTTKPVEPSADDIDDDEADRREDTAAIGVLILVGITSIGLLLIAAALVWGANVRRITRHQDSPPTQQDDLWYLRKGQPPPDSEGDAAADDENPND